eukprot:m.78958 g.78958  ORF g.78958 m.78958 type:complete len:344 (-) comp16257_c0_seq1:88-1119(-)
MQFRGEWQQHRARALCVKVPQRACFIVVAGRVSHREQIRSRLRDVGAVDASWEIHKAVLVPRGTPGVLDDPVVAVLLRHVVSHNCDRMVNTVRDLATALTGDETIRSDSSLPGKDIGIDPCLYRTVVVHKCCNHIFDIVSTPISTWIRRNRCRIGEVIGFTNDLLAVQNTPWWITVWIVRYIEWIIFCGLESPFFSNDVCKLVTVPANAINKLFHGKVSNRQSGQQTVLAFRCSNSRESATVPVRPLIFCRCNGMKPLASWLSPICRCSQGFVYVCAGKCFEWVPRGVRIRTLDFSDQRFHWYPPHHHTVRSRAIQSKLPFGQHQCRTSTCDQHVCQSRSHHH